ncbi:metal ABC transporter permease [Treponema sp.]|uniref:metal ABC transporter permease n=1 Tax=Treponema sp. TaxID=166 RepID=UPI00298D86B2|nr:metal ABC transporter permease [Treponema sp.]MCQ2240289.1 metal ABC transporter permease [Treponema sp.]
MMNMIYSFIDALLPFEWLSPMFMKNAFLAILIACPLFGMLGTSVVSNRMSFFSDAIGHSALTGIALGVIIGIRDVTVSMIAFSLLLGFAIISVKRKGKSSSDTIIGVFSSTAVALGIVLLSAGGNFAKYQKYLVGDILSIQPKEILLLIFAAIVLLVVWVIFYNRMLLVSMHAVFAKSRGIKTFLIEQIFALLTAVIVTVSIRWTGLLVINSLLVLPAAASRLVSRSTGRYTLLSVLISLISGILGLALSYQFNTASGASIVLVNAVLFMGCLAFTIVRRQN